jgi:hypothetical protein
METNIVNMICYRPHLRLPAGRYAQLNMNTLTLGHGHRKGETFKNGSIKTDRKYIDFIVSGQSLGELFGLPDFDLIGVFGWTAKKGEEIKHIDEFLGLMDPELETGRTCLYVCPECGDIGCGAITARLEINEKNVMWKDFGYENNYSEPDLTEYQEIGPFVFDKTEYIKTFELLKHELHKINNWA